MRMKPLSLVGLALALIAPWVAVVVVGSAFGSALGVSVVSRLRPVSP